MATNAKYITFCQKYVAVAKKLSSYKYKTDRINNYKHCTIQRIQ